MERYIDINTFDYPLPDERIAKFPLENRSDSKLLVYRNGDIHQSRFGSLAEELPTGSMLVFNNTKVIRARVIMHKPSGARIEVFCLEPHRPADYEDSKHDQRMISHMISAIKSRDHYMIVM